ncbi:MAG: hypothetical protein IJU33_03595 [Bacteroidales bacterium]|nr:hypothetical protein [Bacteroidales bacterium]
MKKLFLSLVLVLTSIVMFAQGSYKEVVYLKNGSMIKGVILEQVPNESVKIQTSDGNIFVYPMSEVQKITKEQSEPEKPMTQSVSPMLTGGKMERDGRNLELNGRELSDEEVLTLVGRENYETYLSAQKQIGVGRAFTPIFFVSLGSTIVFTLINATGNGSYGTAIAAIVSGVVADVSLPLMCIFKGIGKGRMNWVADEYNRQNRNSYSWSLSPSIMRINAQPDQANLGAGMTFSVNF